VPRASAAAAGVDADGSCSGGRCRRRSAATNRPRSSVVAVVTSLSASPLKIPCQPSSKIRLGSRVVSVLDSGAERPGFKSQSRRCRVTVLDKLFAPIVPLFSKQQQNW